MTCSYEASIGGHAVAQEIVGYGGRPPQPFDRHITRTFFSTSSSSGLKRGTIIVTELDRCPRGAEIAVTSTIKLEPGTRAGALTVVVRA